jgi:hypothetical protein
MKKAVNIAMPAKTKDQYLQLISRAESFMSAQDACRD